MNQITLRAARVNVKMSQIEAAKKLNIAPSTLRNWEKGKTFPKQNHIAAMCKLYGIKFDNIFFGDKSTLS